MSVPVCFFASSELQFVWDRATDVAKVIICLLAIFSIFAWSMMTSKALQMSRARKLNLFFGSEYNGQRKVLGIFDRRLQVNGCPMFAVYQEGCAELDARLKNEDGEARKRYISLKGMEHVKRTLEGAVARESLKLESGLILLAIAVSGAPFFGLLGTVWGVMDTFAGVGQAGKRGTGHDGPRRLGGVDHDGGRIAGGDSFDVRLQLAGAYIARADGGTGQFCAGPGVENGNGVSEGTNETLFTTQFAGDVE